MVRSHVLYPLSYGPRTAILLQPPASTRTLFRSAPGPVRLSDGDAERFDPLDRIFCMDTDPAVAASLEALSRTLEGGFGTDSQSGGSVPKPLDENSKKSRRNQSLPGNPSVGPAMAGAARIPPEKAQGLATPAAYRRPAAGRRSAVLRGFSLAHDQRCASARPSPGIRLPQHGPTAAGPVAHERRAAAALEALLRDARRPDSERADVGPLALRSPGAGASRWSNLSRLC